VKEASVADITSATPGGNLGLAGRDRVRADSETGTGYRTFPSRIPVILTALGGGLVVLGSLGASVRASAIQRLNEDPQQVRVLMGHEGGIGWILAGLGLALMVLSFAWLGRRRVPKAMTMAVVIATGAIVASRLLHFNEVAAGWADAATSAPRFIGFHAGLGWGAWALLVGAILAGFGVLVGLLRELDVRKGFAG
jgi:hypothetical protein